MDLSVACRRLTNGERDIAVEKAAGCIAVSLVTSFLVARRSLRGLVLSVVLLTLFLAFRSLFLQRRQKSSPFAQGWH